MNKTIMLFVVVAAFVLSLALIIYLANLLKDHLARRHELQLAISESEKRELEVRRSFAKAMVAIAESFPNEVFAFDFQGYSKNTEEAILRDREMATKR